VPTAITPETTSTPRITNSRAASFPAEALSVPSARRFVSAFLRPLVREDVVHVAALLTSELATNSVLHARTAVDVEVSVSEASVRIEVSDAHPTGPRRVHADRFATFGRGLELVETLSEGWGVSRRAAGKGVWFALAR
jgi:anti-sigma regulatory factor (Ser/Thr protein kinase)